MRNNWVSYLEKIVFPILNAMSYDSLKEEMPVFKNRGDFQYLEAVGRIICGIAPWLNLSTDNSNEGQLREKYRILTIRAISNLVNPKANDYIDFGQGGQALVDAAYLSQGLLRAPNLWNALGNDTKERLLFEIKKTRKFNPPKNNWLLFASIIEAFLLEYDNSFHRKRLYLGVKKFINSYYIGDGFYGDGERLSIDHYNSFVIHPMLMDILNVMNKHKLKNATKFKDKQLLRYKRYIEIQERMISPEGAYPVFGRTLICRFGTFHALAQASLLGLLPNKVSPSQARCALNEVIKRHIETPDNFDSNGFMTVGFNGVQEEMAEEYVSSGSPYHCSTIFLPLGLNNKDSFWIDKDSEWTSLRAFKGLEFSSDHAYNERNTKKEFIMLFVYKFQSLFTKIKNTFRLK